MYNGEIITYTIGSRPTYSLVSDMLEKALERLPETHQLLMHSDQGWQYQMYKYKEILNEKGIIQSMSRKGCSPDDGLMEGFFGILKREMFYGQEKKYASLDELEQAIRKYIDYYNTERTKDKLKELTPIEYRNKSLVA